MYWWYWWMGGLPRRDNRSNLQSYNLHSDLLVTNYLVTNNINSNFGFNT
jgi:hypothetical protein